MPPIHELELSDSHFCLYRCGVQISGQASIGKSAPVNADSTKAQQGFLKAGYPALDPSFGVGPQTPGAATSAGRFPTLDASTAPRAIPLSAMHITVHPLSGDPADPQKLAASWVTNQQFGDAADRVSYCCSGSAVTRRLTSKQASCSMLAVILQPL